MSKLIEFSFLFNTAFTHKPTLTTHVKVVVVAVVVQKYALVVQCKDAAEKTELLSFEILIIDSRKVLKSK